MAKQLNLLFTLAFFSFFSFGQKPTVDFFGELDDNMIRSIFNKEATERLIALENDGKIIVTKDLNLSEKKALNGPKLEAPAFDIMQFRGKKFAEIRERLCNSNVTSKDFIEYFNSLSEDQKTDLLLSGQGYFRACPFVMNEKEVQQFILKQYEEQYTLTHDMVASYKINFLQLVNAPNFLDSIEAFLDDFSDQNYFYHNEEFIRVLYTNGRQSSAIRLFENLVEKKIASLNSVNKKIENSTIGLSSPSFETNFLFDATVSQRYIEKCLKAIESNVFSLGQVMDNIQLLWRSNLLNIIQKKRLVVYSSKTVRTHSEYKAIDISRLQSCFNTILADYFGTEYLKNYRDIGHLNADFDFPAFEIRHLVRFKRLKTEEQKFILNFVKLNYNEKKINWEYFDGKSRIMKNLTDFSYIDKLPIYDEQKVRNYLDSIKMLDINGRIKFEKNLVSNSFDIDIVRPLPLTMYVWSLVGNKIPEVKFDLEANVVPLDYIPMIEPFIKSMKEKLGIDIDLTKEIIEPAATDVNGYYHYKIGLSALGSDSRFIVDIISNSDWYSPNSIINVLNLICKNSGFKERWFKMETTDQTVSFIFVQPKLLQELNKRYKVMDKYK